MLTDTALANKSLINDTPLSRFIADITYLKLLGRSVNILVGQFVAESRFANCEFANLFFDFDESRFSRFQKISQFITISLKPDKNDPKNSEMLFN